MKKRILCFALLRTLLGIILLFTATACSEPQKPTDILGTYVIDMANDGIISEFEKTWWTGSSQQESGVQKEISVTFEEISYNCTYQYTRRDSNDPNAIRVYSCESCSVYVDQETGAFRGIHFPNRSQSEGNPVSQDPKTLSETVAKEYAKNYIDLSQYTMSLKWETTVEDTTQYTYEFVRYYLNYKTCDKITITVNSDGTLSSLLIGSVEALDHAKIPAIDTDKVERSIQAKLDSLYADLCDSYEYTVEEQILTYTPEKTLAMNSYIEIVLHNYGGSGEAIETGVVLSTIIE